MRITFEIEFDNNPVAAARAARKIARLIKAVIRDPAERQRLAVALNEGLLRELAAKGIA